MKNIIVEGDSMLVINTVRKLQNDTKVGKIQRHWRLAYYLQKIQEHLQTGITVELHWVRRSANGLADRIANEGVDKEGSDLDATWINIPNGQFQTDCTQLAAKDYDDNQSTDECIEAGGTELNEGQVGSRPNPLGHLLNTSYNADHSHTTRRGTTPWSCQ
jgi:ribonuclease HI